MYPRTIGSRSAWKNRAVSAAAPTTTARLRMTWTSSWCMAGRRERPDSRYRPAATAAPSNEASTAAHASEPNHQDERHPVFGLPEIGAEPGDGTARRALVATIRRDPAAARKIW